MPEDSPDFNQFDVIIDSGCTWHMVSFQQLFITCKPCHHLFVILADKSRVPCLGIGCVSLLLGGRKLFFMMCYMFHAFIFLCYRFVVLDISKGAVF
ncbi:MAG: hypothetical protein ACK53Y_07645 [bacterium]